MVGRKPISEEERFWEKVDKSGLNPDYPDCWEWTSNKAKGYGMFSRKRDGKSKNVQTHRYIWEKVNGQIPDGLHVCHICNNPPCVRPDHLEVGTRSHNMRYAVLYGNNKQSRKTHCVQGHPFDETNTKWRLSRRTGLPSRQCRACMEGWKKKYRDQRRKPTTKTEATE